MPISEALATCVVLAHPRTAFHPCKCGLRGGTAAIAAVLISYNIVELATRTTTRRRRSWSTTSSTPTHDYFRSQLQLFFRCSVCLMVTIHDLLLTSILRWHSRYSASVAYPLPYLTRLNQIRMVKVVVFVVTPLTTRTIVLSGLLVKVKIILLLLMNPFMLTFQVQHSINIIIRSSPTYSRKKI
jgi:hypothetical protein